MFLFGLVAQLVRAPPCHGGGRRFESDLGRICLEFFAKQKILSTDNFYVHQKDKRFELHKATIRIFSDIA